MSQREEMVTIPAKQEKRVVEMKCDCCGMVSDDPSSFGIFATPQREYGAFDRIGIYREAGTSYPEGGSATHENFHLCGPCWETKLVPWFAAFSATPTTRETDW